MWNLPRSETSRFRLILVTLHMCSSDQATVKHKTTISTFLIMFDFSLSFKLGADWTLFDRSLNSGRGDQASGSYFNTCNIITSSRWQGARVLFFHHSQSEPRLIDTRDNCSHLTREWMLIVLNNILDKSQDFCPMLKGYMTRTCITIWCPKTSLMLQEECQENITHFKSAFSVYIFSYNGLQTHPFWHTSCPLTHFFLRMLPSCTVDERNPQHEYTQANSCASCHLQFTDFFSGSSVFECDLYF